MSNLSGMPVRPKETPDKPNPAYLRDVRKLGCCICEAFGFRQFTPTEAHHPIHGRFSGHKRPDETAIPLCRVHHRGQERGDCSVHFHPAEWKVRFGEDTDYIKPTQDRLMK